MTRTIEINGKTITLESGKTPTALNHLRGRGKGDFRILLESMKPGESTLLPFTRKTMSSKSPTLAAVAKATGHKYASRAEGNGYRIYCLEAQPATRKLEAVSW